MAIWDYKEHNGVYSGVSDDQIRALIQHGTITRDTEIAKTGIERWQAVGVTGFRADCERAESATYRDKKTLPLSISSMPEVRSFRIGFAATVWIVLTVIGLVISWHSAANYDPEKNGTYNMAEAAMLDAGWTQVIAEFISALLLFVVFATLVIIGRLNLIAQINRAGHLAVVEELKAMRTIVDQTKVLAPRADDGAANLR